MKKIILTIVLGAISFCGNSQVKVQGHYKANGTYVAPYERTVPNKTIIDNYSTYPNVNPHTGKVGTVTPTNYNYNSNYNNNYTTPVYVPTYTVPTYTYPTTNYYYSNPFKF